MGFPYPGDIGAIRRTTKMKKGSCHYPKLNLAYGCTCSPHGTLHTEVISDGNIREFTDTPVACSLARAVVNVYTLRKRALRYRA